MNTKKCEHCGEEIHIKTKKCPFCGEIVEIPEIIEEVEEIIQPEELKNEEKKGIFIDNKIGENITQEEMMSREIKNFIYTTEMKHAIEHMKPLSNIIKVFLTAFCMLPFVGQVIGIFFGIFFLTYDDKDRKSYGKSIIALSIIMFCFYMYYAFSIYSIMNNPDLMKQIMEMYK